MTTVRTAARRPGFSLIELLVVVGILGLLAAVGAAAFLLVGASQRVSATESTVAKLAALLERKRAAVVDAINSGKDAVPADVLAFAGGDTDRAKVVWIYLRLKQEFPTTGTEAITSYVATSTSLTPQTRPTVTGGVTLQRRDAVWKGLPNVIDIPNNTITFLGSEAQQSAGCLYLALTQTGGGGVTTDSEGLQNQSKTIMVNSGANTGTMQVFVDSWGNPIMFARLGFAAEVNSAKYVNTRAASPDPADPLKKLPGWANLSAFWTVVRTNHYPYVARFDTSTTPPTPIPNPPTAYPSPPQGWTMTLVSAGPDENLGSTLFGADDTNDPQSADNIVSFRLRAGMKGQ